MAGYIGKPPSKVEKPTLTTLPEELKKAKNKLFYFSLIIIFVTVFEPSFTGFLGNFSINISKYPLLFLSLIFIGLCWLALRYISIFSTIFEDSSLLLKPHKALNEIYLKTSDNSNHILSTKTNIDNLEKELNEFLNQKKNGEPQEDKFDGLSGIEARIDDRKNKILENKQKLRSLYFQRSGIKYLIGMDLLTPLMTFFIAIICFSLSLPVLEKKIQPKSDGHKTEYKIKSATIEVKNIELKQITPETNQ
ncbi:hypothetical protein P8629_00375 [Hydrogenovibrio sp. 3SP14C1]|uniref:hypothetical protein n=1 Tax=Hydrogenovibrio sp. 3SP14C1 TaxID=3038774 RepID=UPI0024172F05|nr:hypothetical protein [Hydrogenovibrio sp. 3SP14C1]MDG4811448.1 hypothetical protein [Hydrogenovibrio sp. 3SP14C1]